MPEPIKEGRNFEIKHRKLSCDYSMKTMIPCTRHYEIGYTITGDRKTITPNYTYDLHSGNIGTTPINVYLRTISASDIPYESILLKYTEKMAEPFIDIVGRPTFERINNMFVHRFSNASQQKIQRIMFDMLEEYNHYNDFSEIILQGMLTQLFVIILTERLPDENNCDAVFAKPSPLIMKAVHYMEYNHLNSPSLKETASHINVSPEHLSRLFKQTLGTSYSEYQTNIRLRYACRTLLNTDFSIEKVAEVSGFSSANYMSDVFSKQLNISPSKYRKSLTLPL